MENVYLYVAVAAFVAAAVLLVAAIVIFVRMDVLSAIRFLQGKRVPVKSSGVGSRNARSRVGRAKAQGRATDAGAGTGGDDRVTDDAGAPADDSATTVVNDPNEVSMPHGDDSPTTVVGAEGLVNTIQREEEAAAAKAAEQAAAERAAADAEDGTAGSETPTEVLTEDMDEDSERPTGVLTEEEDDSERPTGVLGEEDSEDSERPTGLLTDEDEEDSERPTGLLVDDEDEESERPTGVLVEDEEDSERPTGLLAPDEDEAERETELLDADEEDSEQPEGAPEEEPADVTDSGSSDTPGVVQQEEDGFRFILKQNVIVVHTDEQL